MKNTLRGFIRDTGWSLVSLATVAAVQFLVRAFLARYFGAGELGLYTLAFTIYALGLVFSGFGVGTGIVKFVAENREEPENIRRFATNGTVVSFITGTILGAIIFALSDVISTHFFKMPDLGVMIRIVSLSFPFIAIEKAVLGYLNGLRRMRLFAIINMAQSLLVIVLTIIFAYSGLDIQWAVTGLVAPVVVIGALSLLAVRKNLSVSALLKGLSVQKGLLAFGLFVVLANAMGTVMSYASSTIIGFYMADSDVGYYSVALILIQVIILPASAVQTITSPMIAGFWATRKIDNIEYLINTCLKYTAIYSILLSFILYFLSEEMIRLFFDIEYIASAQPLRILLIGSIVGAPQMAIGGALSSTAYVNRIFLLSGLGVVVSILSNILLIPTFGIAGAAIATSITTGFTSVILLYFTRRWIGIKIDRPWFVRFLGLTLAAGGITTGLNYLIHPVAGTILGVLLLAAAIMKFLVPREEKKQMREFIGIKLRIT